MEIKDQTMTTDVDAAGHEYIAEIDATYTETSADGTQVEAEITTTADPNDPTQIEGHMLVTTTAPDGTETVAEYFAEPDGDIFQVEEESALESAFEAVTGIEIEDALTPVTPGAEVSSDGQTDVYQAESGDEPETDADFQTNTADFTAGDETLSSDLNTVETSDMFTADAPIDTTYGTFDAGYAEAPVDGSIINANDSTDDVYAATSDADAAELAEQEAHAEAAKDAQESADEFIAQGDYAAAAEARETAENESWEAGDDSMLSAYDAQDLTNAAEKQQDAAYYETQQATLAQQGDYEGAREAADNAAYATYDADTTAGGDDHTGQADAEKYNMDNAVWQEGIAKDDLDNAAYYAEAGNFDAAEASLDSAETHQAAADNYGDLGEHGGEMAVYDASSEVATGGTYESTYDSSYDTTAVDTGFDATAVDTSSTYDTGTDDV